MFAKPSTTGTLLAFGNLATCSMGAYLAKYTFEWLANGNDMTYGAYFLLTFSAIMVISPYLSLFCKD